MYREIHHPSASLVLLRRPAGEPGWSLLLTRHANAVHWMLPGAHIHPQETPDHTAVRAAHEATGHAIVLLSPPHQLTFPDGFGAGGETAVSTPWWILREQVPAGRCPEPHHHVEHVYAGLIDAATPTRPGRRPPTHWANAGELTALDMSHATRRLGTELLTRAAAGTLTARTGRTARHPAQGLNAPASLRRPTQAPLLPRGTC
jgi:8-oxo-dGTP pyrophosphatase MutT (NUDIX family)